MGINSPRHNHLLAGLTDAELDVVQPFLTQVKLDGQHVLHEIGDAIEHVYFPAHGLVSLLADTGADDPGIAVAVTGAEGMVGTAALLGARPVAFQQAVVQIAGSAWRMSVADLRHCLDDVPSLRMLGLHHLEDLGFQVAQSGACSGRHSLSRRCGSWLLAIHDRAGRGAFPMTQEALSLLLGVRRPSVSLVLATLQEANLIHSGRGMMTVLDPAGLETTACGCYRLVRDRLDEPLTCS